LHDDLIDDAASLLHLTTREVETIPAYNAIAMP